LFVVVALLAAAGSVFAADVYVNAAAAGANDGSSWANAFTSLQAGITAGSGNVVRVAAGTYKPTTSGGDVSVSFVPAEFVTILGGYKSDGTGVRDTAAFKTIMSGDLSGNDVIYDLTLDWPNHKFDLKDNAGTNRSDNSLIVVNCSGKKYLRLDGLTVTGGNNTGGNGGGIVFGAGDKLIVNDCAIDNNYCNNNGGGIYNGGGGAIELTMTNSLLTNNTCKNNWGGGINIGYGATITFDNVAVKGNVSWDDGAGGLRINASVTTISNCLFQKNYSWDGAALVIRASHGDFVASGLSVANCAVTNCIFDTNYSQWSCVAFTELDSDNGVAWTSDRFVSTFTNCLFNNNKSVGKNNIALGFVCTNTNPAIEVVRGIVKNCTSVNNSATQGTQPDTMSGVTNGSYFRGSGGWVTIKIENTILWNPGTLNCETGPNPAHPHFPTWPAFGYGWDTSTSYSCIERVAAEEPNSYFGTETANISADPQFVVADPLYNVQATSPTIDSGNPASAYVNEAKCNGGRINMGYTGNTGKATSSFNSADLNCDDAVNLVDFNTMASQWLQ